MTVKYLLLGSAAAAMMMMSAADSAFADGLGEKQCVERKNGSPLFGNYCNNNQATKNRLTKKSSIVIVLPGFPAPRPVAAARSARAESASSSLTKSFNDAGFSFGKK